MLLESVGSDLLTVATVVKVLRNGLMKFSYARKNLHLYTLPAYFALACSSNLASDRLHGNGVNEATMRIDRPEKRSFMFVNVTVLDPNHAGYGR